MHIHFDAKYETNLTDFIEQNTTKDLDGKIIRKVFIKC